jgi:L-seryl-tRNA(Ser) seleniumtransferase
MRTDRDSLYRQLPQVGEFLTSAEGQALLRAHPRPLVVEAVRNAIAELRRAIGRELLTEQQVEAEIQRIPDRVSASLAARDDRAVQPVINATGVILQTNLGRAPLSEDAIEKMAGVARGYCNLEFDLGTGRRGHRGAHAEELLIRATGCDPHEHAALIVNNCAAATFLALNSLAEGGEVIVSRGELVEIGGGFRVPDILRKSGARLVEVGTTNRTRIDDYAAAITSETRLILRVHRSNFEITGFTEQAELRELVQLGTQAGVAVMVDQGTGCLLPLDEYGLGRQSSLAETLRSKTSLVCASGDKLLGGPQCGLIVGGQSLVRKMRMNPLYRAFRVDKLTIAALESTLLAYLSGRAESIPVARMLQMSADSIRMRCEEWAQRLNSEWVRAEVVPVESVVGGGTTPGATLPSFAVALRDSRSTAEALSARLRLLKPPVIGRIHEGLLLLDLRTVFPELDEATVPMIAAALADGGAGGTRA